LYSSLNLSYVHSLKGIFKEYSKSASTTYWVWSSHSTIHAFDSESNSNLLNYLSSGVFHLGFLALVLGVTTYSISEQSNYLDWSSSSVSSLKPLLYLNLPSFLSFFGSSTSTLGLPIDFGIFNSLFAVGAKSLLDLRYICFSLINLSLCLISLAYSISNLRMSFLNFVTLATFLRLASGASLMWSIHLYTQSPNSPILTDVSSHHLYVSASLALLSTYDSRKISKTPNPNLALSIALGLLSLISLVLTTESVSLGVLGRLDFQASAAFYIYAHHAVMCSL